MTQAGEISRLFSINQKIGRSLLHRANKAKHQRNKIVVLVDRSSAG